ncbi:aspartyl-phosphate phosphatase Spo0E family protein [Paenibacillus campi]|uniref:aspartyl-phosphate phosphatase Spo0E family protein n=1 Tax=Paenibacillus campi TaxID=3106031 RepID=UPI002AFF6430|nr:MULTISPECIES: aspartyl-phosphate phosphatase Spo0E family protein [unclassified Paenibacillus]
MTELKQMEEYIEIERRELNDMVQCYDLHDHRVLDQSRRVDSILNQYNHLKQTLLGTRSSIVGSM